MITVLAYIIIWSFAIAFFVFASSMLALAIFGGKMTLFEVQINWPWIKR